MLLVQESLHWQMTAAEDDRSQPMALMRLLSGAGIPNRDAGL